MLFTKSLPFNPLRSLLVPYIAPSFVPKSAKPPSHRYKLVNGPTPIHTIVAPDPIASSIPRLFIKRDDATHGPEMGGNKLRKLEFLLSEAQQTKSTHIITIGGVQSNHCRATACAAALLGFNSSVVLRCPDHFSVGSEGNLLWARAVGTKVKTVTAKQYGEHGSSALLNSLAGELRSQGEKPYIIPVGGSNALGTWGYIEAANEFHEQSKADPKLKNIRHVVFATGSGGTAAGLAIGMSLAFGSDCPKMHAVCVCDNPNYFYKFQAQIISEMGFFNNADDAEAFLRETLTIHQGRGKGYAVSTDEETSFLTKFARHSGVLLDPVYTGKVMYTFAKCVEDGRICVGEDEDVLFYHTGGQLGTYENAEKIASSFEEVEAMDLSGL